MPRARKKNKPDWERRAYLAVAAFLFLLCVYWIGAGLGYRKAMPYRAFYFCSTMGGDYETCADRMRNGPDHKQWERAIYSDGQCRY